MRIPQSVTNTTAGLITPAAVMFLNDSIKDMIPWLITMLLAKWGCLFIAFLEGISVIGNILKPMGIDLSMKSFLKIFANRVVHIDSEEASELVGENDTLNVIKHREKERWEHRKKHEYGAKKKED